MKRARPRPPPRHKVQKLGTPQANLSNTQTERTISDNTLKMKFMQRGEEAARRERLEEERLAEEAAAKWAVAQARRVVHEETSMAVHKVGRRSFGHFNVIVEKLAEAQMKEARRERERWHQSDARNTQSEGDKNVDESSEEVDVREELMAATLGKRGRDEAAVRSDGKAKKPRTERANH